MCSCRHGTPICFLLYIRSKVAEQHQKRGRVTRKENNTQLKQRVCDYFKCELLEALTQQIY